MVVLAHEGADATAPFCLMLSTSFGAVGHVCRLARGIVFFDGYCHESIKLAASFVDQWHYMQCKWTSGTCEQPTGATWRTR